MRLHHLELENLNSLRGRTVIDFDQGPLGATPLFLIHGPTGAGKSTLMDAVSLALFAATARLGRDTASRKDSLDAEDPRNVMTRGTGSCRVQLVFSRMDGNRRRWFRAGWSVHRAREAPDGAFQNVKRELVELSGPRPDDTLAGGIHGAGHRKADYEDAFREALAGMTREDFQRTMLLAQGEFAAFLKAGRDERSAILKRVVDTALYRELGARAAARWRVEKERLAEREASAEGIEVLSDQDRLNLEEDVARTQSSVEALEAELKPLEGGLQWVREALDRLSRLVTLEVEVAKAHSARADRDGDALRLTDHQRVEPALRAMDERDRLVKESEALDTSILALQSKLDRAQEPLEARRREEAQCTDARNQARQLQAEAQPELVRAREAAKGSAIARERMTDAESALASARETLEAARTAREAQAGTVAELDLRLKGAHEAWDRLAPWHALAAEPDALAPVQSRVDAFARSLRSLDERAEASRESGRKAAERARELDRARTELAPLAEAVTKALEALPSGSEPGEAAARVQELRAERERLGEEIGSLEGLLRTVAELHERETQLQLLAREVEELGTSATAAGERLAGAEERVREVQAHLETARRSLEREREVEAHLDYHLKLRGDLRPGDPCAVCGSTEHPVLAEGPAPELTEARERSRASLREVREQVTQIETRLEEARKARNEAEAGRTRTLTLLEGKTSERVRLTAELEVLEAGAARGWRDAGGEGDPTPEGVRTALDRIREEREAARGKEALWLELDRTHRSRTEAYAGVAALEASHRSAQEGVRTAEAAEAAARSELDEARDALQRAHASLPPVDLPAEGGPGSAGSVSPGPSTPDSPSSSPPPPSSPAMWTADQAYAWLAALRAGVRRARDQHQELERARVALEAARAELGHRQSALDAAAREVKEREAALVQAGEALDRAAEEQARHFDGRDPEEVAQELDRALREAQESLERAQRSRAEAESAWETMTAKLQERAGRRDELAPRAEAMVRKVEELLDALGLTEEGARAVRLEEGEASRLTEELTELDERLKDAWSRRTEAKDRWEEHRVRRPASEPDPGAGPGDRGEGPAQRAEGNGARAERTTTLEFRLADLETSTARVRESLKETRDHLTRLDERRQRDDDLRKRRERELSELDRARRDAAVWEELANLIGTREGAAFEEFAQSLVLDRILLGANQHLERLRPRYRFVRAAAGEGTFDFVVRDAHLAGQERPLTTLSGGETFLASLALALGLAGMRTQELPIETLLLDEGFGTLDPASLEDAITVLEGLHERGYRVGLISHVEALRERIGRGIQVRPTGGGFSEVVVHGG